MLDNNPIYKITVVDLKQNVVLTYEHYLVPNIGDAVASSKRLDAPLYKVERRLMPIDICCFQVVLICSLLNS
ncbi:MAG: hypothetical protein WC979_02260 [Candidatus Pacearchaeota archaeon]|jgi:hypothetical protein|nr:hypothetical protein [Clostridia bacterium]